MIVHAVIAERDAEILRRTTPDPELAGLAEYVVALSIEDGDDMPQPRLNGQARTIEQDFNYRPSAIRLPSTPGR